MNEVRGFLVKGICACAVSAAIVAGLAGIENAMTGSERVYTASAAGIGEVTMTATFNGGELTDISLDVSNETPEIGGAAAEQIVEQLIAAQSSDIDGVAGATVTTDAARACLDACIAQAEADQ